VAAGVSPREALAVADDDPGLFVTWAEELAARADRELRRARWTSTDEILRVLVRQTGLARQEALLRYGVPRYLLPELPEIMSPAEREERKRHRFSPREFVLRHLTGG
jgi:hypothetical protein